MAKKFLTGLDLASQKIANLADGSSAADAATYGQLQAAIRGLVWKAEVKAATTANITLSGTQTIDGIACAASDRVLVKDQTTASGNGIYVVAAGAWSRATDLDEGSEFTNGVAVTVEQGTVNGDKAFVMSTDGAITIGTTSINFVALGGSGSSYTAGNGLNLSGATFSVVPAAGGGLTVDGSGVGIDTAYSGLAKRYSTNVPSGSTSATITHNLGTLDVHVAVFEVTGGVEVECDVTHTSTTVVTLGFATAPTTNQYRVVVIG
ncbi:MAG TPA: hypothetical protein PKJ52_01270 [Rectinema sp.]|nr:hypothetical protein [Rectinema sp.]